MISSHFYRTLTVRLEFITYILVVPMACVFIIFANGFDLIESLYFLGGATAASSFTGIVFPSLRYLYLKRIVTNAENGKRSGNSSLLVLAKAKLLNFPLLETVFVQTQWITGITIAASITDYLVDMNFWGWFSFAFTYFIIFFVNNVSHFFTTEIIIGRELSSEEWIAVPVQNVRLISFRARIFFSMLSVVWLCFFLFGYLLFLETQKITILDNFWYFLPTIGIQLCLIVGMITYLFAYSAKKNTNDLVRKLQDLAQGNIGDQNAMISSDEIGFVTISVNQFSSQLESVTSEIGKESDKLFQFSDNLLGSVKLTTERLMDQAAAAEEMSAATQELHTKSEQVLSKTDLQMKQMEKTNMSLNLLNKKIKEIQSNSEKAVSQSEQMEKVAESGSSKIKTNIGQMEDIREITLKIQGISGLVGEIADRVGLLSLNASIEAARAGDAGRGFAVVAQEISKLGESTQKNSKDIDSLVNKAVSIVNLGTDSMKELGSSMGSILSYVEDAIQNIRGIQITSKEQSDISDLVSEDSVNLFKITEEIVIANQEQAMTFQEIANAVNKVAENTSYLVNISEDNHGLANSLQDQASQLQKTLSFFNISGRRPDNQQRHS
ncbi:methyl-accepting chemotaxis protein [Leptospira kobayashii]|uniref:Methyl-accepting chemotaxis protein n=1 Tax=Leptospira kobayashii TaxID=1917830 RepID=A0ABM7UGT6_9LEPT|nr:methyl-accepting chemotaxis protein [Leptospira kobayashii]BDA77841.1 methyl-accepting chemotaxis protein [Leptospira kobayashii]